MDAKVSTKTKTMTLQKTYKISPYDYAILKYIQTLQPSSFSHDKLLSITIKIKPVAKAQQDPQYP